jgi:hypothetical protein
MKVSQGLRILLMGIWTNWNLYTTVQTWTSILLALYSAALLAFSREPTPFLGGCERG